MNKSVIDKKKINDWLDDFNGMLNRLKLFYA